MQVAAADAPCITAISFHMRHSNITTYRICEAEPTIARLAQQAAEATANEQSSRCTPLYPARFRAYALRHRHGLRRQ